MPASPEDISKFINSSGAKAFTFDDIGATIVGSVVDMDLREQTDPVSGEVKTWSNGQPRMVLVVTLQTELQEDEGDDGQRSVWLRGGNYQAVNGEGTSSLTALKDALKKAGVADLEQGGKLAMKYTGEGKASARGMNAPKLYMMSYQPPTKKVAMSDLLPDSE